MFPNELAYILKLNFIKIIKFYFQLIKKQSVKVFYISMIKCVLPQKFQTYFIKKLNIYRPNSF